MFIFLSSGGSGPTDCFYGFLRRVGSWSIPMLVLLGLADFEILKPTPLTYIIAVTFGVIGIIHGVIYTELYDKKRGKNN